MGYVSLGVTRWVLSRKNMCEFDKAPSSLSSAFAIIVDPNILGAQMRVAPLKGFVADDIADVS